MNLDTVRVLFGELDDLASVGIDPTFLSLKRPVPMNEVLRNPTRAISVGSDKGSAISEPTKPINSEGQFPFHGYRLANRGALIPHWSA